MPEMAVTLIMSDGSNIAARVSTNRHGQLPAVIVDPRDGHGRVVSGAWLSDSRDQWADGTTYQQVRLSR
jgi:hypothetical protein